MSTTVPENATDAEVVAGALIWLTAWIQASEQIKAEATAAARALWAAFDGWYDDTAVAQVAREAAAISVAAQQTAAGMASQYVVGTADVVGVSRPVLPPSSFVEIRNGVGLSIVHSRPAHQFRRAIAVGKPIDEAIETMTARGITLTLTDVVLQERGSTRAVMEHVGIQQYRRVIHPELSETGTCGLCIAAADRLYNVAELMPIHPPSCKCTSMPVTDVDPGDVLNREDIKAAYAQATALAGSTGATALSHVRFQVNEHGEFGPVLTRAEDEFRGPDRVALEDDPERARRLLSKIAPVLALHRTEGEPVPGALAYEEELYERLLAAAA